MDKNEKLIELRNGKSPVNHGRWTDDELNILSYMFMNGAGLSEIALALNRSERAVSTQASQLGLYRREQSSRVKRDGCMCEECPIREKCTKRVS